MASRTVSPSPGPISPLVGVVVVSGLFVDEWNTAIVVVVTAAAVVVTAAPLDVIISIVVIAVAVSVVADTAADAYGVGVVVVVAAVLMVIINTLIQRSMFLIAKVPPRHSGFWPMS